MEFNMEVNGYKDQKKVSLQGHKFIMNESYVQNFYYMNVSTYIFSKLQIQILVFNCSKKPSDISTWSIFLFPSKNINISQGKGQQGGIVQRGEGPRQTS